MAFFTVIGIVVTIIFGGLVATLLAALVVNFIGYQKGARNYRDYVYYGADRSQWFWTKYGVKRWLRSFKHGGGWHVETADPEDDNYDLRIYENGSITRHTTRYPG